MAVDFEFDKAGRTFQSRRLDPWRQGAALKRVVPLLGPMLPLIISASKEGVTQQDALTAIEHYAPALAAAASSLKDEDLNWLMETSLSTLKIQDEGVWMPFWNKGARMSMFADMNDLSVWLPLTIEVLKENLTPFFLTTVTSQSAKTTTNSAG